MYWSIILPMEMLVAVGLGVGLASVAGVRAFLPLALAALFTIFGLFEFPAQVFGVDGWIPAAVFGVLALLEIALDKIRALQRVFNIVAVPIRAVSGAVLFAAALGLEIEMDSVPWLVVGAVIASLVAVLKVVLRPSSRTPSTGVSPSFLSAFEDVVALVGGAIGLFVPYLPALLVAFLLFFFNRIKKRRGRKFGGLRILGD